jgi:hypothetical protein
MVNPLGDPPPSGGHGERRARLKDHAQRSLETLVMYLIAIIGLGIVIFLGGFFFQLWGLPK